MAVEVEERSAQERFLKFQIPKAEVATSIEESIGREAAKMRGRHGGSDAELRSEIETKRGDEIRETVKLAMMDKAYEAAIAEKEISAARKPDFENVVFDPGKDPALTFEAAVKIWPAYEIKDVGPCKKHLKCSICPEKIVSSLEESLEEIQKNTAIKGFRRGKAPVRLVERQFGKEIRAELKQRLIAEAFQTVTTKEKISPLGEPDIKVAGEEPEGDKKPEEKLEEKPEEKKETHLEDGPIEFEVTVEVEPVFEVEGYEGLKLQEQSGEPTQEETDRALDNLRQRAGELVTVDGAAQEGDAVLCDYKVTVDGEVVADAQNAELAATGSNVTGISAREVGKILMGSKAGESKTGKFKLTDAFPKEELRNKEADVAFTIKEIKRVKKPEANDAFAKELGYDSIQQLQDDLVTRLRANKEQAVRRDIERQIADRLLEQFKFDLPEEMVKRQAAINAQRQQLILLSRGVPREDVARESQAIESASQSAAERDFKLYFILEKIGDKQRIYATEDEVEERVSSLAMMRGFSPHKLHQQLERDGSLSTLRRQLREEKMMAFLREKAEITKAKEGDKKDDKTEEGKG